MESALRPREIQSRIRAGQSLDEVARVAGVPQDRLERFAAPVLAEREHVASLALTSSVRRRGDTSPPRGLEPVARERLLGAGVDPDQVDWDAWRNEDKRWSVQARWTQDDEPRAGLFSFDLQGRFSVAVDADARWLIAEGGEAESADADEELALVRVVGGGHIVTGEEDEPDEQDNEPTVDLGDRPAAEEALWAPRAGTPDEINAWLPRSASTPQEIREQVEAEIDTYGVVPEGRSELDVLYDMLGGIAEDSINIYAGLTDPVVPPATAVPPPPVQGPPSEPLGEPEPAPPVVEPEPPTAPVEDTSPGPQPDATPPVEVTQLAARRRSRKRPSPRPAEPPVTAEPAPVETHPTPTAEEPTSPESPSAESEPPPGKPEQTVPARPTPKRKGGRKKRASVPSWDEIMFGGPPKDD